jgi:UDP-N-acetylglucosamine:LPS N-acetylglucosamine transferase
VTGKPKLLALASGGGHWVELMRLRPAFADFETVYVSMFENYADQLDGAQLHVIPDATRFNPHGLVPIMFRALKIMAQERPDAIITTGAAPALPFVVLGRIIGCHILWIDSIANSDRLTLSGRVARAFGIKVVTQWPDVAALERVDHWGAIL